MDANLAQRRASLEEKIPDIKKTLDMVEYLQERRVRLNLDLDFAMALTLCFLCRKARARLRKTTI